MRPNFGNSGISIRQVDITSILLGFDQKKNNFLRSNLGSSSIICDFQDFRPMWQKG